MVRKFDTKKKEFTLAERFALTTDLRNATIAVGGGTSEILGKMTNLKKVFDMIEPVSVLEKATESQLYGKRTNDIKIAKGEVSSVMPVGARVVNFSFDCDDKNGALSAEIFDLEKQMVTGDNKAERQLRALRANEKYGRRCTDINLDV
jgi:hypothetical protein